MNVLVVGGSGYIGSVLVPMLLERGHDVLVIDTMWLGYSPLFQSSQWKRFGALVGDIRSSADMRYACKGRDAVICLASISAEEMCQRDPKLAREVNVDGVINLAKAANGLKRFIYASSVAAYAASERPSTEDGQMEPTTIYGRGKVEVEGWLGKERPEAVIVRSASVCGCSPRMRFDLTVNKMVHDAVRHGRITVNGGEQKRSHVHIQDICDFYCRLLDVGHERIYGQTFNVVAQNLSVLETAEKVIMAITARRRAVNMPFIEVRERTDNRSYTVDGTKAREMLGFTPKRTIDDAAREVKEHFDSGYWTDSLTNPAYMNLADGLA